MANLKLKNPAGGSLNLVSADGASDLTVTFPATTGTAMVSGNMPTFSAYMSAGTSVPDATWTKLQFNTELWDTNSNYDTSTYRFTPTVSGYYQINFKWRNGSSTTASYLIARLYKNGSVFDNGNWIQISSSFACCLYSGIVYFDGVTDYVEAYCYQTVGSTITTDYGSVYQFSGALVRAA